MPLLSEQIRAGRNLIRMTQEDLSARSGVPLSTVKRIESNRGPASGKHSTVDALRAALEDAGIEFIDGEQPGVRFAPGVRPA